MRLKIEISWILIGFILIGVSLSLLNFLNFRSLWLDEVRIGLNIVEKSVNELLQPLDYNQVAPIGFLLIEKIFASLLGNADWTMRIFPLLAFLISIFLLHSITYKILKNNLFALFASAFFATSILMLSYSSEVKQYMTDVAFTLTILLTTITYNENGFKNKWWIYALIGMLSIWFSNISVLLLFTAGFYSLYRTHYSIEKKYKHLVYILGLWVFSFVIYYSLFIHDHPTKDFMTIYWQKASAFLPQDILSVEFYKSLSAKIKIYFGLLGSNKYGLLLVPIFFLGLFFLGKEKKAFLYLLVFPVVLHLILAYIHLYPFSTRLILYLYPSLLIIITSGLCFIYSFFNSSQQKLIYVLPLFLAANILIIKRNQFPIEKEEIKKSMSYIKSKFVKGDNIYVYYGAKPAFEFYRDDLNKEIDDSNVVLASAHGNKWSNYHMPISKMNDPVWILFSHVYRMKNEENLTEEEYILNIFREEGYQIIDEQKYKGSSVYYAVKIMPTPNQVDG
ncbi:MAG: glycosyltransferase family 39 protein [Cyclobacteriaceae bacterium]